MHTKGRFRNVLFDSSLHPGSAALAILVMLLFLIFLLLFMTFTAQPVQGQSSASAQNTVPPTARQAAAMPEFASRLHPPTPHGAGKPRASAPASHRTPSPQDNVIYENGPVNGTTDAWTINFGYVVSDTFFTGNNDAVTGFGFNTWEFPGDMLISVSWSITTMPNAPCPGNQCLGSGTVSGRNLTDRFISTNQYGYDIDWISASNLNVGSLSLDGTYYLNLFNAAVPSGDPVYWDENSGVGSKSSGCPSQAAESADGTIPSESFDVIGNCDNCGPPPPTCFEPGWGLQVIHDFASQDGVGNPNGVTIDKAGNLYGTSDHGGQGSGMAYSLSPKGNGWVFTPLYSFLGGSQGATPGTVIVGPDGGLYGDTWNGGLQTCGDYGTSYCGLVYRLRPKPFACLTALCGWQEDVLYQFAGGNDTWFPNGGLVFDREGNIYGTTGDGYSYSGAVFELTPSSGGWIEKLLYSFTNGSDYSPYSLLMGYDGNWYGAAGGGAYGFGAIFRLVPSGNGWTEQELYSFPGDWGQGIWTTDPQFLVEDSSGNLYGAAQGFDQGVYSALVFMLSPSDGQWTYSVLLTVTSEDPGYNEVTIPSLAIDAAGNVYFAINYHTPCGRGSQCSAHQDQDKDWGAVLMKPYGSNEFQQIWGTAYNELFGAVGPLAIDIKGNVYGTTSLCGQYGQGTVWQITP